MCVHCIFTLSGFVGVNRVDDGRASTCGALDECRQRHTDYSGRLHCVGACTVTARVVLNDPQEECQETKKGQRRALVGACKLMKGVAVERETRREVLHANMGAQHGTQIQP